MKISSLIRGAVFVGSCLCLFGQAAPTSSQDPVVAEIGGQKLTLSALEENMASRLFQARQQYYTAERAALEQWIDDQVLANEARGQNLTVDQLLERNIHVADPTEDQLRVYYEGLNTDQPFEAVRDKVLQHIRDLRRSKLRAAYVKSLREKADVQISFASPSVEFAKSAPVLGPENAQIRLVEFADYECPYCQQAYPVVQKVLANYGSKVSFAFRDFPLPMHPDAPKAAEAARCAGVQGKYWDYHNALFTDKKLAVPDLKDEARKLALDTAAFDKCLDSGTQTAAVASDASEAQRLQLTGTPTFFINGHLFTGAANFDEFRKAIDKELAAGTVTASANR